MDWGQNSSIFGVNFWRVTYGICCVGVAPMRLEASDASEMVSQMLYGDVLKVSKSKGDWLQVSMDYDGYRGWVDVKQVFEITEIQYEKISTKKEVFSLSAIDVVNYRSDTIPIPMGASVGNAAVIGHSFVGILSNGQGSRSDLVSTAIQYLNAPYLWGGKTLLGIDCSGLTQMVYRVNNYKIARDAKEQALQGTSLSFLEESEPGDLAFFSNKEDKITHVGMLVNSQQIVHAHGRVRIDYIDYVGIFNTDINDYSHKLRLIKRML